MDYYSDLSSSYSSLMDTMVETEKSVSGGVTFVVVWTIIAFIVAILCSVLVYFLFIKSKNVAKGTTKTIKDYLNCDIIHIEALAKMFYYAATVYVILNSVSTLVSYCSAKMVGEGLFKFFVQLFLGPIVVRFAFEIVMLFVRIWKNTENLKK